MFLIPDRNGASLGAGACLSFQPAPTNEAVSANCRRELQGRVLQSYIRR